MKTEYNQRGFAHIDFKDRYGLKCSIQKSSLAFEDAIWLGVDDAEPRIMAADAARYGLDEGDGTGWVKFPIPEAVLLSTRMHLTQEQVIALLPVLTHFAETGELPHLETKDD